MLILYLYELIRNQMNVCKWFHLGLVVKHFMSGQNDCTLVIPFFFFSYFLNLMSKIKSVFEMLILGFKALVVLEAGLVVCTAETNCKIKRR